MGSPELEPGVACFNKQPPCLALMEDPGGRQDGTPKNYFLTPRWGHTATSQCWLGFMVQSRELGGYIGVRHVPGLARAGSQSTCSQDVKAKARQGIWWWPAQNSQKRPARWQLPVARSQPGHVCGISLKTLFFHVVTSRMWYVCAVGDV